MAYKCPPHFTVYEKPMPGYTVRVALDPKSVTDLPPEQRGYKMSDDQESPVYTVMRRTETGIEHGGEEDTSEADKREKMREIGLELAKKHKLNAKALEFVTAHARLLKEGRVPQEVGEYRLTVCTGVDPDGNRVTDKCPQYVNENGRRGSGHCKGCGCPEWTISEMDTGKVFPPGKAWYPMQCPKGRFSEHNGRRKHEAGIS